MTTTNNHVSFYVMVHNGMVHIMARLEQTENELRRFIP
jgi:hypothetical protein